MKGLAGKIQLVGVLSLAPIALFVTPGSFFEGVFPLAIAAWTLWLIGIAAGLRAFPGSVAGRVAVVGLVALAALYAVSIINSPDRPAAVGNLNLAIAYLGLVLAAGSAFSEKGRERLAEPLAWVATLLAAAWGLSERIAPATIHFPKSRIAFGRLLEPIGYWNAMGALAGIGLVLAVGLAASSNRSRPLRLAAVATSPLLMAALWLSFSRGALAATACGLAALVVASRSRSAAYLVAGASLLTIATAVLCEALPGVRTVSGQLSTREHDGLLLLLGLLVIAAIAVVGAWVEVRLRDSSEPPLKPALTKLALVAALILGLLPAAIVVSGSRDSGAPPAATGANADRLQSLESNRSKYWNVALDQFSQSPLTGGGSGSFRTAWLKDQHAQMVALNAHSLEIEVLAELGLLGIAALLALTSGAWTAGTRRRSSQIGALAAASAGLAAFLSHSSIDWDWQVPGLMFTVGLLAAAVVYAPRKGFDTSEATGLKIVGALLAVLALTWTSHLWEAKTLRNEAQAMVSTAKVLGWTPRREDYVVKRLHEAAWLNPDPLPRAELSVALYDMGDTKAAAQEAIAVARANPDWWFGWALVWRYRAGTDPLIALDAIKKVNELRGTPLPKSVIAR